MTRAAGVLLHPTCLPGSFGIGDLGPASERFIDWLADAGQSYWQILPLGPVDDSGSPYRSFSAFAGNPLLISPERLVSTGLLAAADVEPLEGDRQRARFGAVRQHRESILRDVLALSANDWPSDVRGRWESFRDDIEVRGWLDDWTLFAALKDLHGGTPWYSWPRELRQRQEGALTEARQRLADDICFHRLNQFLFFDQWSAVRHAARLRDVRIIGDLAIYVAPDSADVWAHQELFDLDPDGRPRTVAGVPPDYFSSTGQLWGNPLYLWEQATRTDFDWWIRRLGWSLRHADLLRLDHFRGFAAFWEVAADEETAARGRWRPGPGRALFDAARRALGELPLIAEDLGVITEDVDRLRAELGLPGMKVLQFAFGDSSSEHLPHRYRPNTVVYSGTHDNNTAVGWIDEVGDSERQRALDYLGATRNDIAWALIRGAYTSVADTAIVPLQDVLGLDSSARMNRPGEGREQWSWRLGKMPSEEVARKLRRLAEISGRVDAEDRDGASPAASGESEPSS